MVKGLVNRIIPFSSVDGPGNRTAIFLQGCNFNCLYCHNPETINQCNFCGLCVAECPYGALHYENDKVVWAKNKCKSCDLCLKACKTDSSPKALWMSVEQVMKEILRVKSFISGITVSGGECTLQAEFITELFRAAKEEGLTAFADTNCYIPFKDLPELLKVMDKAMVDLKAFDEEEHIRLTGMSNKTVKENIKYLANLDKLYEIRTVIVPDILNNEYTVAMTSKLIASLNPDIKYKLIKYRPIGVRPGLAQSFVPADSMMKGLADIAEANGCRDVAVV